MFPGYVCPHLFLAKGGGVSELLEQVEAYTDYVVARLVQDKPGERHKLVEVLAEARIIALEYKLGNIATEG